MGRIVLRESASWLVGTVMLLAMAGCSDDVTTIAAPTATPAETATATATATATDAGPDPTASSTATASEPSATDTPTPDDTVGPGTPTPTATASTSATATAPPDIVFIILDDVGIDQIESFGLGGGDIADTPNLSALANAGVRFSNAWSMPECSPSRATIFTGRYPLHQGVTSALIPNMLPQAQVSPYETTLPRVLADRGYASAMVGKYHLGNQNPAGNCSPQTTGFDFFDGNMEAGPPSIDRQAGHVEPGAPDDRSCGYEQATIAGNCYFSDGSCQLGTDLPGIDPGMPEATARACMEAGGIFVSETVGCQTTAPVECPDDASRSDCIAVGDDVAILDFTRYNGYYAWPQTTVSGVLPPGTTEFDDPQCGEPPVNRVYMTTAQTSDSIAWYEEQSGPRMLTVSYNSIHTPYQPAPRELATLATSSELVCGELASDRLLANDMLESMDREIGRLLNSLGLASLDQDGTVQTEVDGNGYVQIPELAAGNTMVVVVGDNGTFFEAVKLPFDVLRSKGSVYETGVRVPLMVSGPVVQGPTGREVDALVSLADLYALFGELAGIDVAEEVPPAHYLDAEPMLPYLTDPEQGPIREFNFTELGPGVFEQPINNDTRSWPCLLLIAGANVCNEVLFDTQDFCNTNSGVWWGPTDTPEPEVVALLGQEAAEQGLPSCCQINAAFEGAGMGSVVFSPIEQFAVRNATHKLVSLSLPDCTADDGSSPPDNRRTLVELYDLTAPSKENPLSIDFSDANLMCATRVSSEDTPTCRDGSACDDSDPTSCLDQVQLDNYQALQEELDRILATKTTCEGDGNLDLFVDQRDADGVTAFAAAVSPLTGVTGGPSFFDVNGDARTDDADAQVVAANLGTDCLGACPRADLNRDGLVDDADADLLAAQSGECDLCGGDLNGDGMVDSTDAGILDAQRGCSTPTPTRTPLPTQPPATQTITPEPVCEDTCIPDATSRQCGCPLYVEGETMIPAEAGIDCGLVCEEYAACQGRGYELGFTCDATVCTSNQSSLVLEACFGIQSCDISEILRAEIAAGCSCCASQLCGCDADAETNETIFFLNEEQREAGEVPQCDINGTLCGR